MSVGTFPSRREAGLSRPTLGRSGRVSVGFLVFLGLGALAGGLALAIEPDGSVMHFDVALLAGSPFMDFFLPGLILGGLFGLGSFIVAAMGLRHARLAPFLAFGIGCAQMIWIVVELAVIKELSFLHPVMFGVGLVIAATAVPWGWPTFAAWRTGR